MFGIALTLVAVIVAMVLAFCTTDDRSFDRDGVAVAWAPEPRRK